MIIFKSQVACNFQFTCKHTELNTLYFQGYEHYKGIKQQK